MRNESTQQLMSLLDYSVSRARRKNFFKND